jgi:hypothetical protein
MTISMLAEKAFHKIQCLFIIKILDRLEKKGNFFNKGHPSKHS